MFISSEIYEAGPVATAEGHVHLGFVPVPEPGTGTLLGCGPVLVSVWRRFAP